MRVVLWHLRQTNMPNKFHLRVAAHRPYIIYGGRHGALTSSIVTDMELWKVRTQSKQKWHQLHAFSLTW